MSCSSPMSSISLYQGKFAPCSSIQWHVGHGKSGFIHSNVEILKITVKACCDILELRKSAIYTLSEMMYFKSWFLFAISYTWSYCTYNKSYYRLGAMLQCIELSSWCYVPFIWYRLPVFNVFKLYTESLIFYGFVNLMFSLLEVKEYNVLQMWSWYIADLHMDLLKISRDVFCSHIDQMPQY